jgi:DNA-binding winged helix-turn-helix (wHTH) protein
MYFIFDRFELDRERHQLLDCDTDQTLALRPQAFSVLVFLLERAPATVSRDELLKGVWGHTALSSSGVSQAIREIRRTLGDDANDPKILATRHGCGYQLIAPVQIRSDDSESEPAIVDLVSTERERLPETRRSSAGGAGRIADADRTLAANGACRFGQQFLDAKWPPPAAIG